MSDLEKREAKANEEYQELLAWAINEEDKVVEQLKKEGAVMGLDGHQERFAYINKAVKEGMKKIIFKYDLPNKAQWA